MYTVILYYGHGTVHLTMAKILYASATPPSFWLARPPLHRLPPRSLCGAFPLIQPLSGRAQTAPAFFNGQSAQSGVDRRDKEMIWLVQYRGQSTKQYILLLEYKKRRWSRAWYQDEVQISSEFGLALLAATMDGCVGNQYGRDTVMAAARPKRARSSASCGWVGTDCYLLLVSLIYSVSWYRQYASITTTTFSLLLALLLQLTTYIPVSSSLLFSLLLQSLPPFTSLYTLAKHSSFIIIPLVGQD